MILTFFLAAALIPGAPAPSPADSGLPRSSEEPRPLNSSSLSPEQAEIVRRLAKETFCYCGCPHTLEACLREHPGCPHAPRMVTLATRLVEWGLSASETRGALDEYYSGFDRKKRAKLDVKEFGPPLGGRDAPISIVVFSDFTCPYCRALRPELERFAREQTGRAKILFKPFPIGGHARAKEAATAAEWARDRGAFWKMHDLLFDNPRALTDDDLVSYAERLGLDGEDLRKALAEERYGKRIAASQAEARAARIHGTPALYVEGRRLAIPVSPADLIEVLRFTLADEEEWTKNGKFRD